MEVEVLARFRNLRPINSLKHVIDLTGAVTAGTQTEFVVSDAKDNPILTNPAECQTGARVSSIYLDVEVNSTERIEGVPIPNCYMMLFKNIGSNLTPPSAASVGTSDLKRYVLHQEMVMLQNADGSNPRTLFKGVIKIPRGFARIGNDDQLVVIFVCGTFDTTVCVQCIYKEYK